MQDEHDNNLVLGQPQGSPHPYSHVPVRVGAGLVPALESVNPLGQRLHTRRSTVDAELTRAHVALLEKEVIQAQDVDMFRLVKYYYRKLQDWHDQHTGWHIRRSSTVIRLLRHPSSIASGYVTDELKEPRDFACFAWILWYAESRQ